MKGFLVELGAGFVELGTWIDTFFGATIPNAIDSVLRTVGGYVDSFLGMVGGVVASVDKFFGQDIPNAIDSALRGFGNFVSSVPGMIGQAASAIRARFQSVLDFVKSIPGRIAGFFSGLGSRIGSAIGSIHFPTPHVSWEGTRIPGLSLPKIQWYAQGGFVNGARLIGVGEKGTELIWPSYGAALNKYANAIAKRMPNEATSSITNVTNNVYEREDAYVAAAIFTRSIMAGVGA